MSKNVIKYAVIGGGFRAQFYLKVAQELPELFQVCGISTASPEKTEVLRSQIGVKAYSSTEELLRHEEPDFLVVCKNRSAAKAEVMDELVGLGLPILMETPAAWDEGSLLHIYNITKGKAVQVAEQFWCHPENAARLAVARSGILGDITQMNLSGLHTYHGLSLIRKFLGVMFEEAEITARSFAFPAVEGYMRGGISPEERVLNETREIAIVDFGGKMCLYDYENKQQRSYVRSDSLVVRGERGEVSGQTVRWLEDHKTPLCYTCERLYAGVNTNLEGFFLRGIMGGEKWLYRNPYESARLCDDEIAIAAILTKMGNFACGGPPFYSVAEACQDQYLSLMIERAAKEKATLRTQIMPWAE